MLRAKTALLSATAFTFAASALAGAATPDRIYKSDGSILEDVTIVNQGLATITYKPSGSKKESEVDSWAVLSVEFSNKPEEVSLADVDADNEGFGSALAGMENYLANLGDKKEKKFPWAPDYARYRIVELNALMNDVPAMVAAVDSLLELAPESRYVPLAMIDKIETQILNGDNAGAKASSDAMKALITEKGLVDRWKFEQQLLELRATGNRGEAFEKSLQTLARSAAAYPTVSNAADVATADSLLQRSMFAEAEALFRGVAEDPAADDATLAAAWTGLGDCLYRRAEAKTSPDDADEAKALYEEARRAFMRTVVNYRYQYAFVAQSAFYAGRCFQEIGGESSSERSSRLFRFVVRNFPGSKWAGSAKEFERRNR